MKSSISLVLLASLLPSIEAAGFRTVGSSGCAAQLLFVQPFTTNVVFLDNYHPNFGGPGVDLATGAHSTTPFQTEDETKNWVFATSYDWTTNALRKLNPKSNTFCSAGAFLPDGTVVNMAGSEADGFQAGLGGKTVVDGFVKVRTYAPGPCTNVSACTTDIVELKTTLQAKRWYPTAEALLSGDILVVGGSNAGLLVTNEANINVPSYEIIKTDFSAAPPLTPLPALEFTQLENLNFNKSFNLYPVVIPLPNNDNTDHMFTITGNKVFIWDYSKNTLTKDLPDTPLEPRNFPSSATVVLLPLKFPDYNPMILMCGGSSTDIPNPLAMNDCYTIKPWDAAPVWAQTDNLPNGGQTMTDAILLPDGKVLLINGAHKGCAGGYMAEEPVLIPLIYDHAAAPGSRFTAQPPSTIPRLYHSVASLLPSGEIIVAGSNPDVFYTATGTVPKGYPAFKNNGHMSVFQQQQDIASNYPTEYRVEIFSPAYMDAASRPVIKSIDEGNSFTYGQSISALVTGVKDVTAARLIHPGFRTHGVAMGQRSVELRVERDECDERYFNVLMPSNATVITRGVYLLFVEGDGVPSEGTWIKLG